MSIPFQPNFYVAELRQKIVGTGMNLYSVVLVHSEQDVIALDQKDDFQQTVTEAMKKEDDWGWLVSTSTEMDYELTIKGKLQNQDQLDGFLLGSPYTLDI